MTKLYTLRDASGLTRYIGKTTGRLNNRLSAHISEAKRGIRRYHRSNWINSMLRDGHTPSIRLIETVEGDGAAEEIYWIARLREMNWPLINNTNGGEGVVGFVPFFSPEHRAKISAAKKGKKFTAQHCANLSAARKGIKPSTPVPLNVRIATSNRFKGIPLSEEHKAKLRGPRRTPNLTPEQKRQKSEQSRERMANPDMRAKVAAAARAVNRGAKRSEECRKRMRDGRKAARLFRTQLFKTNTTQPKPICLPKLTNQPKPKHQRIAA